VTGNTSRHRNWSYTNFDTNKIINHLIILFHVYQKERCPTSNKEHFQGYFQLKDPKNLSWIKNNIDEKCHFEAAKGNCKSNIAYCTKEESRIDGPWTIGKPKSEQGKRNDLLSIKQMIDDKKSDFEIAQEHFGSYIRYHKGFRAYRDLLLNKRDGKTMPNIFLITGKSGCGKTQYVYEKHGIDNVYEVIDIKWWDGYEQQPAILFDEVSFYSRSKNEWLKILDRWPHKVQRKGGMLELNSPFIYLINSEREEIDNFLEHDDIRRRITKVIEL